MGGENLDSTLKNTALVTGLYNLIPTPITSNLVETLFVNGLTITKVADKEVWADGPLTYTITISNEATQPYTNLVLTDLIDITKADLIADTVKVNGLKATYTYVLGLLTVNLADLAKGETVEITFQVTQM